MATLIDVLLNVDSSQVNTATGNLGGLNTALSSSTAATVGLAVAFVGLAASMAIKWGDTIDSLADLGDKLGYTTNEVLVLDRAMKDAGGSLEGLESGFDKVAKSSLAAATGSKAQADAYANFSVSVLDANGALKDSKDLTEELTAAYEKSNKTGEDRASIMAVLGKNYKEIIVDTRVAAEATEMLNKNLELGIGISEQSKEAADKQEKALQQTAIIMADMGSEIVEVLLPAITSLVDAFNESYTSGGLVRVLFVAFRDTVAALGVVIDALSLGFTIVYRTLEALLNLIPTAITSLNSLLKLDFDGAKQAWSDYSANVGKSLDGIMDKASTNNERLKTFLATVSAGADQQQTFTQAKSSDSWTDNKPALTASNIKAATDVAKDPYKDYLVSLDKMLETQEKLNQAQRTENEIKRISVKFAEDQAKIERENAQVRENKTGQLKSQLDPAVLEKEIALIRERAATIDKNTTAELLYGKSLDSVSKTLDDYNESVDKQIKNDRVSIQETQRLNAVERVHEETLKRLNVLKKSGLDTAANVNEVLQQEATAIDLINEKNKQLKEANDDWVTRGAQEFINSTQTMNEKLTEMTEKGLNGVVDGLVNMATTGKSTMKDFVRSMLVELERYLIKLLIVQAVQSAMGIGGEVKMSYGSVAGITAQAADGAEIGMLPNGGHPIIVGEQGPEMFIPKTAGTIVPNNKLSSSGSMNISNVNNITINSSGDNSDPADQQKLAKAITAMIDTKFNENLAKARRPGGQLNSVSMQIG